MDNEALMAGKRVVPTTVKWTEEEWAIMQQARDLRSSLPVDDAVLVRTLALERAHEIIASAKQGKHR